MKTIVDTIGARNYFLRDNSAIPNLEGPYSTIADVVAEDKQKFYYMGCDKCFSGIDAEYNYVYTCNSCKEAIIAKPRSIYILFIIFYLLFMLPKNTALT
ncbi:hypothetical protein ACJIZ3_021355 [Penstemon smallii]|uniref:Uncharacterized protein n=1 Tax=Penstemon smallii TaxID=265156 RepID=A0ABD3SLT2_9LAMI